MMMIHDDVLDDDVVDDVLDDRDTEDGISPMMAAVGAGRLEVVRHLVNQHSARHQISRHSHQNGGCDEILTVLSSHKYQLLLYYKKDKEDGEHGNDEDEVVDEDNDVPFSLSVDCSFISNNRLVCPR